MNAFHPGDRAVVREAHTQQEEELSFIRIEKECYIIIVLCVVIICDETHVVH